MGQQSPHHVLSPWFRIVLITLLRMTWWLSFTGRWRSRGLNETMNEWGPAGPRVNRRPCFRVLTGCSRAERRLHLCERGYPHDSSRNHIKEGSNTDSEPEMVWNNERCSCPICGKSMYRCDRVPNMVRCTCGGVAMGDHPHMTHFRKGDSVTKGEI